MVTSIKRNSIEDNSNTLIFGDGSEGSKNVMDCNVECSNCEEKVTSSKFYHVMMIMMMAGKNHRS